MSSRSNGVTKVVFTRRTIACVVSSAWCSASRMRRAIVLPVGGVAQHLREQLSTVDEVLGGFGEEVVEGGVDRAESQTHG